MPQVNPEMVLRTVKSHLPTYFDTATTLNVKAVRDDEFAIDTGYNYIAVRQDGDSLVVTAHMTWDGDNYGTIDNIPDKMPLVLN